MYSATKNDSYKGVAIGLFIILLWVGGLVLFLQIDMNTASLFLVIAAVLIQTFLYTGLFITAHDAMHGVVYPQNLKVNNFIGSLAVILYALFSYRKLHKKHWEHHKHPAGENDPDYHDGENKSAVRWYLHFMLGYLSWWQIAGMALVFNLFHIVIGIPVANLILFWALPAIASTWQLFYFGTYLPHREPAGGYTNRHNSSSNDFGVFLSFITCYHFGYHLEHHEFPYVQWWKLPRVREKMKQQETTKLNTG